jgi:hypothetical protein
MGFLEILLAYVNFLWQAFQFDIEVFSHWWMYAFLCVPAVGYLIFFCFKWFVITLPIWYIPAKILGASPFGVVTKAVKKQVAKKKEKIN